jgi:tetratricopeptide (TPR) repeat protein
MAFPLVLMREGDVDGAVTAASEAAEIAEQIGAAMPLCEASALLGKIATNQGRLEQAVALAERAVVAGHATGIPFLEGMALCTLGTTYLHVSERLTDRVVDAHTRALETMKMPTGLAFAAMNWCEVGMCALQMGKPVDALELFEKGLTLKSAPMYVVRPELHLGAALAHLQLGRLDEAGTHASEARAFAEPREMRSYYPAMDLVDGYVAGAAGDADTALEHFSGAVDQAESLAFRPTVWTAAAEAADLLDGRGDVDAATAMRDRGRRAIDEIAGFFTDARMRDEYVARATARLTAPR